MNLNDIQIKTIIDSFVDVYGEKNRNIIDNKIKNCLILLCGYKPKEELSKIKDIINKKYLDEFMKQVKEQVDLSDYDLQLLFENDMLKKYSLIENFGTTAQEIFDVEPKNRMQRFQAKQILQERETFYNVSEIKNISTELADKLSALYNKYSSIAKNELLELSLNYEENKHKIAQQQFLEDVNFDLSFYDFEEQQHNGVQPNFILDNEGNPVLYPIVNFSTVKRKIEATFGADDYFDVLLIHELNHIIGMHLLNYNGKSNYQLQMGLTITDTERNTTKYYYTTMIDEILNQKIAKEVTKKLHNKGMFLIDAPNKSKIDDTSLYEMGEFLLDKFFEDNFGKLLQIYATGKGLEEFYQEIDLDNAKELGKLIEEYLRKSNEDDLSEEEKKQYLEKSNVIVDKISGKNEREKLIETIKILDLNNLDTLTEKEIKEAYDLALNKYGNSISDFNLKNELIAQLTEYFRYAIENVSRLNKLENSVTNLHLANMYSTKKSNIISDFNKNNPKIMDLLITSLYNSESNFTEIMIFLNSIEYGLIILKTAHKIIEIYGEEFYHHLTSISDMDASNIDEKNKLISNIESIIINTNTSKSKSK